MPIFGRHTKTWSWESHESIGSPLGPSTQEISHVFHLQKKTKKQQQNLDNLPSSHNIESTKILGQLRT